LKRDLKGRGRVTVVVMPMMELEGRYQEARREEVLLVMSSEACKQLSSLHLHLAWSLFRISVHVNIPFFHFVFLLLA
jgi:hypothetical protein